MAGQKQAREQGSTELARMREYFGTGVTRPAEFRIRALRALGQAVKNREGELLAALSEDLGKGGFEAYATELGMFYHELSVAEKNLKKWMKPRRAKGGIANFPSKCRVTPEPKGVVLIFVPWNYPLQLGLVPLVAALAAGNAAYVTFSERSPASSDALVRLLSDAFDPRLVCAERGSVERNGFLLAQTFDHIFFTGSTRVGRIVYEAAAKNLTPVTLELGGKSPVVVDATADLKLAARRIVWGKCLNCGQTCVAPDYLLAERSILPELVEELKSAYLAMYPGGAESPDWGKLIDAAAFDRAERFLEGQEIVWRGGTPDREKRRFPFTLMFPAPNAAAMEEELFCPILPILPFDSAAGAKEEILKRPTPLALYVFTRDARTAEEFTALPFGGGCINDTVSHLLPDGLPFGGAGESGLGSYHGYRGFFELSHFKSVLSRGGFELNMKYPPYGSDKTLRRFWK